MRWNKRQKVERPEFPKLLPIAGSAGDAASVLALILVHDPEATVLDGGERGLFLKVHNEAAEAAANSEVRSFPLA